MTVSRIVMLAAALALAAVPTLAQGRGGAHRPAKMTSAKAPKAQAAGKPAKAPKAAKVETTRGTSGADRSTRADRSDRTDRSNRIDRADRADRTDRTDRAERADRGDRTDGTDRTDATFVDRINANPQRKAQLEAMLPSGMTLAQAAEGFRSQGQFVAALETSKNQNISFTSLKTEMTGENPLSLGQALQKLKSSTMTGTTTPTTTTPAPTTTTPAPTTTTPPPTTTPTSPATTQARP